MFWNYRVGYIYVLVLQMYIVGFWSKKMMKSVNSETLWLKFRRKWAKCTVLWQLWRRVLQPLKRTELAESWTLTKPRPSSLNSSMSTQAYNSTNGICNSKLPMSNKILISLPIYDLLIFFYCYFLKFMVNLRYLFVHLTTSMYDFFLTEFCWRKKKAQYVQRTTMI